MENVWESAQSILVSRDGNIWRIFYGRDYASVLKVYTQRNTHKRGCGEQTFLANSSQHQPLRQRLYRLTKQVLHLLMTKSNTCGIFVNAQTYISCHHKVRSVGVSQLFYLHSRRNSAWTRFLTYFSRIVPTKALLICHLAHVDNMKIR